VSGLRLGSKWKSEGGYAWNREQREREIGQSPDPAPVDNQDKGITR
jgi:hypothetical protein